MKYINYNVMHVVCVCVCTCLTGSGTLFTEQATTSFIAVSRDILWPTDTYTGLIAPSDVRTACVGEK